MKRIALLVLATLFALAVSACGASDPIAAEEVSAAVEKTAESGSSRIEISGTDDGEEIVMVGVADYERRLASFRFEKAPKDWQGGQEEGFRVSGRTMYVSTSIFGAGGVGEKKPKPWFKIEYDSEEDVTLDTLLFPFPFVDPGRLLATFQKVSGAVETLGEEAVRGVPTYRYRLTLDLDRLIATAPERHRVALRKELAERERTLEPVEIWIDDAGLARRVRVVLDSDPVSIDFFNFGIGVDVAIPAADQVEDFDALLEGEMESGTSDYGEIDDVETSNEEAP